MKNLINLVCALLLILLTPLSGWSQIDVDGNQTATILAQKLTGPGVTVSNATLNCPPDANGLFTVTFPNITNLGLDSGIVLTSGVAETNGFVNGCNGPALGPSNTSGGVSDADLSALCAQSTFDGCILEFDFVPLGDTVKFDYVFGSTEYPSFTCTAFNDVFGFFISGPNITGPYSNNSKNIALVPGSTTCPVGVSTIYCPNQAGCCNTTNYCFGQTPGCGAFNAANNTCAYFVCNANGASVNYQGFTTVLTAQSQVTPCSTHHLKLAISDAADQVLDSGVFLKAGSLSSNAISLTSISILNNPQPYIVEGCAVGYVKVTRPVPSPTPYTVFYQLGGNATLNTDYNVSTLPINSPPGQVIIPANDTVAYVAFYAFADGIAEPNEDIKLYYLAPCSTVIADSATLIISDNFIVNILTADTTICAEDSVHIQVFGSDSLAYSWTPVTNINNVNIKEPTVSPNTNTSYIVCATLPNSGCTPTCDTLDITINQPPSVNIGNDTIICRNMVLPFNPTISPNQAYTYTWSGNGAAFLNQNNILNPSGTFNTQGNYNLILHVEPQALGCEGSDTMNIQVIPDAITLHNGDTTVCAGATIPINVTGHPLFSYTWTPSTYLNNAFIEDPISNPSSNVSYTVTATYPGCIPMVKDFDITVEPVPIVNVGPDRVTCQYDTVQLFAETFPPNFSNYSYAWSPTQFITSYNTQHTVHTGLSGGLMQVIVSTPIGCSDTDQVYVTVNPVEFASYTPTEITVCTGDTVQYLGNGGIAYHWANAYGISDSTIPNPFVVPHASVDYTIYSTSTEGCVDTDMVHIHVASDGVLNAGPDQTLYPGESTQIFADGNCSSFQWFPPNGLSDDKIKNPFAQPSVTTQYVVTGETEFGCKAIDTVTIRISPESILDLPNAFSPGSGTSINDALTIKVRGSVKLNKFVIYNRWGNEVFETNDILTGWNGQYKGQPQPMGTYVYMIDAVSSTGKRFVKQGNVTLIR